MIFYRSRTVELLVLHLFILAMFVTAGVVSASEIMEKKTSKKTFDEEQFHQVLLAEFYNQSGKPKLTLKHYLPVALKTDDPIIVKRVTEIATATAQLKKGLKAAEHWVELSPKSLEAQQYLVLLLLRDGQLEKSAKQLHLIRQIVDADLNDTDKRSTISKGLKFIGALLVIESHHDKAYQVYNYYLKQLSSNVIYNDQKQLILASLAMKAKKYDVVVSALDDMKIAAKEYFSSAATMKVNALKKLGRIDEATDLLQEIVKSGKASDSLRLELTRLFIGIGKKEEAAIILDALVVKHPDNNDLLKALVALNVSQKQWQVAKLNNYKLSKSDGYKNEVNYFKGEIYEGEGHHNLAFLHYKKVNKGVFLRSSYSKRAKLLVQIEGFEASQQWLKKQQSKAVKNKDKVYWLKLEADLLADSKLSSSSATNIASLRIAIKLYDRVIELSSKKASYRYHRGLLYERSQQFKLAEDDFKYVINKTKRPASALNALGFLLVKHTSRLAEAKQYIQKAYTLKPNDPMILDSMGWVYYRIGDIKKAESFLRKAYKELKTPEVASHLIIVLSKLEKNDEAKRIFNVMIKKYPNNASLGDVRNSLGHI